MGTSSDVSTGKRFVAANLAADVTGLSGVRAIYVGTSGDLKVDGIDGGTVTFKAHPVGYFLGQVAKIYSTANGTTAADLVLMY